jgi:RNA polymerase sigma factor (sigma-70 family)
LREERRQTGLGCARRTVRPLIWSICRRHRLDSADAEDVSQNVWLLLVNHLSKIHDPAALPGWLATVTRRECLHVLSATRRALAAGNVMDAETIHDEQDGTAEQERPNRSCWQPSATQCCARRSATCRPPASS